MKVPGIRVKTRGGLDCSIRLFEPLDRVIVPRGIHAGVESRKQTPGNYELPVSCNRFVQKRDRGDQLLLGGSRIGHIADQFPGASVEIVGNKIAGGPFFNGSLFAGQKFRLQLVGNRFGNFTLDRENISQIAVIGLRPEMRVITRVDQLRVHPHAIGHALHAAFHQMGNAKLLSNLAQFARFSCPVWRD